VSWGSTSSRLPLRIKSFSIVLGLLASIILTANFLAAPYKEPLPFCHGKAVWQHKAYRQHPDLGGYVGSIERVIQSGFCGVELDVIWHPDGFFYVAHDPVEAGAPISDEIKLEYVLSKLGQSRVYWWLDWKNPELRNVMSAAQSFDDLSKKYVLPESSLFVESARLFALSAFSWISGERIKPVFWVTKSDWQSLNGVLANLRSIAVLLFRPLRVSMGDERVQQGWGSLMNKSSLFIFTVDDADRIKELLQGRFDVVLTDLPYSKVVKAGE